MKMEIILLLPNLIGGGAERVMLHLAKNFDRKKFHIVLALGEKTGPYVKNIPNDVELEILGTTRARYASFAILNLIWRRKPAMVIGTLGLGVVLGALRPILPKKTLVVTRLGNTLSAEYSEIAKKNLFRAQYQKFFLRIGCELTDIVVCQSNYMLADTQRELQLSKKASLQCIYNPVDLEHIEANIESNVVLQGKPAIVSIGRLFPTKGYDLLFFAINSLRKNYPNIHLTILGEGEEREALEILRDKLNLNDIISMPGFVDNPYSYLNKADLFVLTSHFEGFSNVLVEALGLRCPVVVTDSPSANKEVVIEGVRGWLAPNNNLKGIIKTLDYALCHLNEIDVDNGYNFVKNELSPSKICKKYVELLS